MLVTLSLKQLSLRSVIVPRTQLMSAHISLFYNTQAVLRLLLERGAEVDHADEDGVTSLCIASEKGYEAVVRLLLERGAEIELSSMYGATSLYFASQNGHTQVAERLLAAADRSLLDTTLDLVGGFPKRIKAFGDRVLDLADRVDVADVLDQEPEEGARLRADHLEKVDAVLLDPVRPRL